MGIVCTGDGALGCNQFYCQTAISALLVRSQSERCSGECTNLAAALAECEAKLASAEAAGAGLMEERDGLFGELATLRDSLAAEQEQIQRLRCVRQ
jgi:hypothetical protein